MWWEVATALLATLTLAGGLLLLFHWTYSSLRRAALAASWCVALICGFGLLYQINGLLAGAGIAWRASTPILIIAWAFMLGAGLWRLKRPREDEAVCSQFANTFSLIAVGGSLATILFTGLGQSSTSPEPLPVNETPVVLELTEAPRDIYYLVFDRYGSEQTLKEAFDYDNGPFLNALKDRGFYVAPQSHANYPKTDLSMAAAFNMQYHGERLSPKRAYLDRLYDSHAVQLLKAQGYQFHHYGTLLDGIRWNPHADVNYWHSPMPTEYTDIVYQFSVFNALVPGKSDRQQELDKFSQVPAAAKSAGPKFVYAHFLTPHYPWKFNADGSSPTAAQLAGRSDKESYVEQLEYGNRRILEMIDAIRANSDREPIIVLQADEGPELMYEGDDQLPRTKQLEQRSGVLSAFALPGRDAAAVTPATISPVNTFRLVFREYFNANLTLLPDRYFYWEKKEELGRPSYGEPCEFVDITEQLLGQAVAHASPSTPGRKSPPGEG